MQIKVERSKFRWIRKHLLHLSYKEVGDACKISAYMVEKTESNRTCDPGIIEVLAEFYLYCFNDKVAKNKKLKGISLVC